jgi:peroxiredoxin
MLAATLGYIGWPRVAAAFGTKATPRPPAYAIGDVVDVPAAWYSTTDTTLVLFARASCGACQKAQPFLTKIVGIMNSRGAAVMAHPSDKDVEDTQFAKSLGVKDDHIVAVPAGTKVHATPTVLLVNRQGKVVGAWEGVGKLETQTAILAAMNAAAR